MVVVVVVVVVVFIDLGHPRLDLGLVEHAVGEQHVLEGGQPALVVAPVASLPGADFRNQLLPEAFPRERLLVRQRNGDPEGATLPRLLEDQPELPAP